MSNTTRTVSAGNIVRAVESPAGPVCHLTTTGRVSGRPRRTEIWYLDRDDGTYLLSGQGEDADWVRNLRADPRVTVESPSPAPAGSPTRHPCRADFGPFSDEQDIREAMDRRYHGWSPGHPLSRWVAAALVVRLIPDAGPSAGVNAPAGGDSPRG